MPRRKHPNVSGMSEQEFQRRMTDLISDLRRRLDLVAAAQRGDASVRRVWRRGYWVERHHVRGHHMVIVRRHRRKQATKAR